MSRSDSADRAGTRRSRRARSGRRHRGDAASPDTVVDTGPVEEAGPAPEDAAGPEDLPEELPDDGRAAGEAAPARGRRAGKGRAGRKAKKAEKAKKNGTPPRRGRRSAAADVDPVSKFSATALRKVSVLGDRPNNVVSTLAEQSSGKRGTAVLGVLLGLCGVALVALLGVLLYLLLTDTPLEGGDKPSLEMPEDGHSTLLPTVYQGEAQDQEIFAPIAERADDAEPLDAEKVFASDAEKLELDDFTMLLENAEATDSCTRWVWGEDLGQALVDGGCTSAARGFYQDQDKEYVAQFTLFDLSDAEASSEAAKALDPHDHESDVGFLVPMDEGVDGLHQGYSQASTQVMGHYLAVYWVARADGGEPEEDTSMAEVNVVAMDAAVWVYEQVGRAKEEQEG
ncbi:hypothetical protein [Nocardiopsis halophila]|uniref:hypothetical protein n=1 Tax=Nocardiopsis halophila TaxID=141692 RepID=UPI000348AA33|nr:hypothetical protein [Nocardiopsis halophila]